MRVKINDEEIEIIGESVEEIIHNIKKKLKGEVIPKIILNGVEFHLPLEDTIKNKKAEEIKELKIFTENPRDLTIAGVLDCFKVLPKLKDDLEKVNLLLRTGKQKEAMDTLVFCIDTLNWFNTILNGIQNVLGLEMSFLNLKERQNELKKLLENFLVFFQNSDWVRISDLIEYELIQNLTMWQEALPDIIREIDKKLN